MMICYAEKKIGTHNGNTLATDGKTFTYDSENHLLSMNSGAVTLLYDGDGNRVAKTVGGVTTRYLIDDMNPTGYPQVVDELVNGSVTRQYTYGLQRISENLNPTVTANSTWTASFYGVDGAGSVRQLTNSTGTVTDTYEYDAFGNKINQTGTTPNNYLYRGERWDADLSLYYLRARWYNPATGSFMSRDPYGGNLWDPSSQHRYKYARANPVNYIDPSGRGAFGELGLNLSFKVAQTAAIMYEARQVACLYKLDAAMLNAIAQPRAANQVFESAEADFDKCEESITFKQIATDTLIVSVSSPFNYPQVAVGYCLTRFRTQGGYL